MGTRERCKEKNGSHYVSKGVKRATVLSVNFISWSLRLMETHKRALFPVTHRSTYYFSLLTKSITGNDRTTVPFSALTLALWEISQGNNEHANMHCFEADLERMVCMCVGECVSGSVCVCVWVQKEIGVTWQPVQLWRKLLLEPESGCWRIYQPVISHSPAESHFPYHSISKGLYGECHWRPERSLNYYNFNSKK